MLELWPWNVEAGIAHMRVQGTGEVEDATGSDQEVCTVDTCAGIHTVVRSESTEKNVKSQPLISM